MLVLVGFDVLMYMLMLFGVVCVKFLVMCDVFLMWCVSMWLMLFDLCMVE